MKRTASHKDVLQVASAVLDAQGQKWTVPRQTVFEMLARQHKPVTAYQLLDLIAKTSEPMKPPSVYRALAFLQEVGLAVRVEGLNAFMLCKHGRMHEDKHGHAHETQHVFFVCDSCGNTDEQCNTQIAKDLAKSAAKQGFKPVRQIVELHGTCSACH